jgi:hypothetical protein
VVGADLECLGLAHDETDLTVLLVLEQLDRAHAALLPHVSLLAEPVHLRLPTKTRQLRIGSSRGGRKARLR